MANGIGVQIGVFLVPAVIIVCFLLMRMRKAPPAASAVPRVPPVAEESPVVQPLQPTERLERNAMLPAPSPMPAEADRQVVAKDPVQTTSATAKSSEATVTAALDSSAPLPIRIDLQGVLGTAEERREQILATISKNIRKSVQSRQAVQSTPVPYPESKTRATEYVRVKKEIITPHDQIRFSILKDWVSTNMLAIFRRASVDWKTPDDLIALLPEYLAAETEILNGQVLLIGTGGHNEKLAVPIRPLDAASGLRECFDFVNDVRTVANTPAVLRTSDTAFEIVSRGVITGALFTNDNAQGHLWDTKLLADGSSEDLQKNYAPSLRASAVGADAH